MLEDAVHGESLLPGMQEAAFLLFLTEERESARGQTTPLLPRVFFSSFLNTYLFYYLFGCAGIFSCNVWDLLASQAAQW